MAFSQNGILVDRISVNDGLTQSDVRCLVQDKFGFLWIGTRDGLNRFDGNTIEQFLFDNEDTTALAFTQIHSLAALPDGNVIIGSVGGFSIYDHGRAVFTNYFFTDALFRNATINAITSDSARILFATSRGVRSFDLVTRKILDPAEYRSLAGRNVTHLVRTNRRDEWVATMGGLFRRTIGDADFVHHFQDTVVHHLNVEKEEVLISTQRGLFRHQTDRPGYTRIPFVPVTPVTQTLRTRSGEIWVAASRVFVLSPDAGEVLHVLSHRHNDERSLSEDRARVLYQTSNGVIWIGTVGYGLNRHNPETRSISFLGGDTDIKLSSPYVAAVYTPDDTTIFVGTFRGADIMDLSRRTVRSFNPFITTQPNRFFSVTAIKADQSGNIWMSAFGGLYLWRGQTFVLQNSELAGIVDFVEFDDKHLLLITRMTGCFVFNKHTKALKPFIPRTAFNAPTGTITLIGNEVWIGGEDGLRTFSREGALIQHYQSDVHRKNHLPANVVKAIFQDRDSTIWIGTWGGGLSRLDRASNTFTTYTTADGLPSNVVYGIIQDENNFLWMSTNHGIAALDPNSMKFLTFDVRDGLQSNEFNTGAYFQSNSGRIYFGGVNGLNSFQPQDLKRAKALSPILLTGATLDEGDKTEYIRLLGKNQNLELGWRANGVTLFLTVIDFRHSSRYRFQYSINGGAWNDLGRSRRLDLMSLAPGQYQVRMRASLDEKEWSDAQNIITIRVRAPFWRHPLALIGVGAIVAFIIFLLYRIRMRNLMKRNLVLDRLVEARTREVHQKNEEITSQNEALLNQRDQLSRQNAQLEQHKRELQSFKTELELRVEKRTHDINALNKKLTNQNAQLEQFSFITAHNFKGPIARIKGLIGLLEKTEILQEEFPRIRSHLSESIHDLDRVTHDLNQILHIRSSSKDDFSVVSMRSILDQVLLELRGELAAHNVTIDTEKFGDPAVMGSGVFLHSVFHNLIENAIKYRAESVRPEIRISSSEEAGTFVIAFADNGIGIDLSIARDKLFHIYQRFSYQPGGRGLGLYMVKTQMEMMGGEVSVTSEPGVGTTFFLHFPKP